MGSATVNTVSFALRRPADRALDLPGAERRPAAPAGRTGLAESEPALGAPERACRQIRATGRAAPVGPALGLRLHRVHAVRRAAFPEEGGQLAQGAPRFLVPHEQAEARGGRARILRGLMQAEVDPGCPQ